MSSGPDNTNPFLRRDLICLTFIIAVLSSCASAILLPMQVQLLLSAVLVTIAIMVSRIRNDERVRYLLMALSVLAAARYITWRAAYTLNFPDPITTCASLALFLSELYTIWTLIGFYFQTFKLDRSAELTEPDYDFNPSVDVFIATYNEDVDILRRTATGAMSMEYPNKKVYILDDGKRPEMEALARELGCGYITRTKNDHAKAGNINNALKQTDGEFILILDADHIPVYTLLRRLMRFFKDPKMALVQSPHRFINPGPIERNLHLSGSLPGEQELFMQIVQVGNDYWNAAFFCGSAAILRRSMLEEVGGIATETVTEDCHTSLRLHSRGYKSKYFPTPLICGLSPESLAGFIIQHCRWAKGSIQMLRMEFPPLKKGLSLAQRLCYFNGMIHFFFGIPRLVFYFAPVVFILFNIYPVKISFVDYAIMASSFLACGFLANSYFYGNYRHTFWSDIYEAVLAPFYAYVTTAALIDPRAGKFNVTPKGTMTNTVVFDSQIAKLNVAILLLLSFTFIVGIQRAVIDPELRNALLVNVFWTGYNCVIVAIAVMCAIEQTWTRRAHRVRKRLNFSVRGEQLGTLDGFTILTTELGCLANLPNNEGVTQGMILNATISGAFAGQMVTVSLPAEVRYVERKGNSMMVGFQYQHSNNQQVADLIRLSYCDPSSWERLKEPEDAIPLAAWELLTTPVRVAVGTKRILEAAPPTVAATAELLETESANQTAGK